MRPLAPLALICALAAPAAAEPPRFEVIDRGDAVEVIARGTRSAHPAMSPVRSRLEVPVTAGPRAEPARPADPTVKSIELDADRRVLSVKLAFERPAVEAIARHAKAIQLGEDLHL